LDPSLDFARKGNRIFPSFFLWKNQVTEIDNKGEEFIRIISFF
jgi:hypothetical protein